MSMELFISLKILSRNIIKLVYLKRKELKMWNREYVAIYYHQWLIKVLKKMETQRLTTRKTLRSKLKSNTAKNKEDCVNKTIEGVEPLI